jgi:ureidoglycolate hydrolase
MSVRIPVRELTEDAFRPYGRVVQRPARDHDASGPGWSWWAETVTLEGDGRPWTVGYLDLESAAPTFDWAERHMRSLEAIVPIDGTCLVYVAPPDHPEDPGQLADFERFEVFRVRPGSAVVMDAGVWHGAPLAHGRAARAIVLLLEGTGRDDVTVVRFEDAPVEIERPPTGGQED